MTYLETDVSCNNKNFSSVRQFKQTDENLPYLLTKNIFISCKISNTSKSKFIYSFSSKNFEPRPEFIKI